MSKKPDFDALVNNKRIDNVDTSALNILFSLFDKPEVISFAAGLPTQELFPREELVKIAPKVFIEDGAKSLQYGAAEGYAPLREKILARTKNLYGVEKSLDEILLASGSQQAMDLFCKTVIEEGDVIFVETPTYMGALNAFQQYFPKFVSPEMDDEGISIADLKAKMEMYPNAKCLYTIPTFQNPTGKRMSLARRKELLEAVKDTDLLILEDNPYGELRYSGEELPTLLALDDCDRVVYMGTFSKIFVPGTRIGWILGPKELLAKMKKFESAGELQGNTITQHLANAYMEEFDLEEHIVEIKDCYRKRRDAMLEALEKYMPEGCTWTHPDGGLFLWVTMPEYANTNDAFEYCVAEGAAYCPGEGFFANDVKYNYLRMNFSPHTEEVIDKGVKMIGDGLKKYLATL